MSRKRAVLPLAGLAMAVALGCGSQPVPLAARAGSSFAFALSGEAGAGDGFINGMEDFDIGYASTDGSATDVQRGEVEFYLVDASSNTEILETQLISRALPDRASDLGITNGAAATANVGIGQVLAVVFIPDTVQAGDYTLKARKIIPGDPNPVELGISRAFEVLPSAGLPGPEFERTPAVGYVGSGSAIDTSSELALTYPHPKILINLPGDGVEGTTQYPYPSAATILIDLPDDGQQTKVTVKDVFEEQHLGQESIVTWLSVFGVVRINFLSRESNANTPVIQLALAFKPKSNYTRIEPQDVDANWQVLSTFAGAETAYYDSDGNEIDYSGAANPVTTLGPIR